MMPGQVITVETFDHRLIKCRLVGVHERTALVCSEREWQRANREKREPDCLGWPISHVRDAKSKPLAIVD